MKPAISVSVPATLTNLGAGFDSLGLAIRVFNRITGSPLKKGLNIVVAGEGEGVVPRNRRNLTYRAMELVFRRLRRRPKGLALHFDNNIPIEKGFGSSAASIVGGMVLANALMKGKLKNDELLRMAVSLEGHPDNVLPAMLGGFTVAATDKKELHYARRTLDRSLHVVVVVPDGVVPTQKARRVLPKKVPFQDAVFNLSRAALTVSALTNGDLGLLKIGMQDRLHESYRRRLFPKISKIVDMLSRLGAIGCAVTGSGPSVVTFVKGQPAAHHFAGRCRAELRRVHLKAAVWVAASSSEGAKIVS